MRNSCVKVSERVTILTMIDEDSVEDAVYSLWQLAMAMASIKHLARMVRTGEEGTGVET